MRENWDLLKEALVERNYFLECAPFMNKEMRVNIPSDSFKTNLFWNFPGVLVYHFIYMWQNQFEKSSVNLKGPKIHTSWKFKRSFPDFQVLRKFKGVSFSEVRIQDAR